MMRTRMHLAACAAACLIATGCRAVNCDGSSCGDDCDGDSPYAFMTYDNCCEQCGGGWGPGGCGGQTCGAPVGCNQPCAGGGQGACSGHCAKCACGGCNGCSCGQPSPCVLVNALCACAGCGERYWNEWYNDPPQCAEPCDCYGNWVGPGHAGYFRAPYRSQHGYVVEQESAIPPLEIADAESGPAEAAAIAP